MKNFAVLFLLLFQSNTNVIAAPKPLPTESDASLYDKTLRAGKLQKISDNLFSVIVSFLDMQDGLNIACLNHFYFRKMHGFKAHQHLDLLKNNSKLNLFWKAANLEKQHYFSAQELIRTLPFSDQNLCLSFLESFPALLHVDVPNTVKNIQVLQEWKQKEISFALASELIANNDSVFPVLLRCKLTLPETEKHLQTLLKQSQEHGTRLSADIMLKDLVSVAEKNLVSVAEKKEYDQTLLQQIQCLAKTGQLDELKISASKENIRREQTNPLVYKILEQFEDRGKIQSFEYEGSFESERHIELFFKLLSVKMPYLKRLIINEKGNSYFAFMGNEPLKQEICGFFKKFECLEEVCIHTAERLAGRIIEFLGSGAKNLKYLQIDGGYPYEDVTVPNTHQALLDVLKNATLLKVCRFENRYDIVKMFFPQVYEDLFQKTFLQEIDFWIYEEKQFRFICENMHRLPSLKEIRLSYANLLQPGVADRLTSVLKKVPHLKKLVLTIILEKSKTAEKIFCSTEFLSRPKFAQILQEAFPNIKLAQILQEVFPNIKQKISETEQKLNNAKEPILKRKLQAEKEEYLYYQKMGELLEIENHAIKQSEEIMAKIAKDLSHLKTVEILCDLRHKIVVHPSDFVEQPHFAGLKNCTLRYIQTPAESMEDSFKHAFKNWNTEILSTFPRY